MCDLTWLEKNNRKATSNELTNCTALWEATVLQAIDSYLALLLLLLAHDGLPGSDFGPCLPTARLL